MSASIGKENPELHDISDQYISLVSKEVELLAKNGVDYSP
jgi:hypothetical protein